MASGSESALAFLFTDLEGSTRLWEEHADAMPGALARHDETLRRAVEAHRGKVFKHTGDGVCAVYDLPADAVAAAADAQVALGGQRWEETGPLRARMAVHVGRRSGSSRRSEPSGCSSCSTTASTSSTRSHRADRLLRGCREPAFLATSREPLGVAGERVWWVPPLAAADAITLFVERARAVVPSFSAAAGGDSIGQVCERLDGIPLAIELAAARVRHLSPDEIAARLRDSLDVIAGGARTVGPRQQSLRAALNWSHDLLGPAEQALFRRLCVFAGGWTLPAAEAICPEGSLAAHDVLDRLAALVDKSMVLVDTAGEATRYRLLEPVRQYAAERLAADGEPGEADRLRQRHRDWCLAMARNAYPKLLTQSRQWLPRMAPERDNFRAALEYSATAGDDEALLRLVAALFTFWLNGGHIGEGRRWARRALLSASAAGVALLAADDGQARRLVARTLELTREDGAHEALDRTLGCAAALTASDGRYEAAARIWGAAESIASSIGVTPAVRGAFNAVEDPQRRKTERALDDATLRRADAEGRAMSIEQAIAFALDQIGAR
jgi:predicted ATPase